MYSTPYTVVVPGSEFWSNVLGHFLMRKLSSFTTSCELYYVPRTALKRDINYSVRQTDLNSAGGDEN